MKHHTGHARSFRVHDHEFVITYDDLDMLVGGKFNPAGYTSKAQLSPEVTAWLEERGINYFVRPGFFDLYLLFNGDDHATLFKLTWGR